MARVQYGSIVIEIKGKNQGHVFQGGNVGFVLRSKGYTPGIGSAARQGANLTIADNASRWRTLSDSDRDAWSAIAADWLFINKFGVPYQGSGFQIYCSYNGNLKNLGISPVDVPGAVDSPEDPGLQTLTIPGAGDIVYERENEGTSADQFNLFATAPYSAGRNNNHLRYRKITGGILTGITTIGFHAPYVAIFPQYQSGQKVSIKVITYKTSFPYAFYTVVLTAIAP